MSQEQPQNHNQSDVARLLMTIDLEYRGAFLGLSGINLGTSRHDFINHRMGKIEVARQELVDLLGENEAGRLIVEQMNKATEGESN